MIRNKENTVLHLPSWYPNEFEPLNGDFIERHIYAVSKHWSARLLYVFAVKNRKLKNNSTRICLNLDIRIVSYSVNQKNGVIAKFFKYIYYNLKEIRKIISRSGGPEIIHVHVAFRAGIVAMLVKLLYGTPYVIAEHWTLFTKERRHEYEKKSWLFKQIIRIVYHNAAYVLPVSKDLEKNLRIYFSRIRTVIIPNVVDDKQFYFAMGKANFEFRFIHVSSGSPIKNVNKIIDSFLRLRNLKGDNKVSLTVIGCYLDGIYDSEYLRSMDISIVGPLEHHEVAAAMRLMHSFVLFSDYETQSCVSIEALCCGLPVISSRLPCIEEFIDETNGILVPPGDEEALHKAMESMILNYDKYNRQRISEDAQAKYNPEVVGRQIAEVYEKVLSKK